jgi:hypothetical protein
MLKNIFAPISLIFASLFNFFGDSTNPNKANEKLMCDIVNISIKQLSQRYEVYPCARGGALSNDNTKAKMEFIGFEIYRKLTKEEARILIVEIVELILANINNNKKITPYLYNVPFTDKNLEITIVVYNKDRSELYHPNVGLVSLTPRGTIQFVTYQPGPNCNYASEEEETYEEAFKIVTQK